MASTTKTPQQTLEDRKVAGMLDDLLEDTCDCTETAEKLSRSSILRSCAPVQSALTAGFRTLDGAMQKAETERGVVLDGKAKDLRKFKGYVQTQVDALSDLETLNGKAEVLEDAAVNASTTAALASITAVLAIAPKVALVQRDLGDVRNQLAKAIIAARDAKVKAAVAAASAAMFTAESAIGAAFNGNEESTAKKTWNAASGAAAAADGLYGLPAAFGPALVLVGGAVDISECFAAERDKADLMAKITALSREFKGTIAQAARDLETLGKTCATARKALLDAIADVKSFRPSTSSGAQVLRYL
jgi:hypothetical protein